MTTTSDHTIVFVEFSKKRGICQVCGPVKLYDYGTKRVSYLYCSTAQKFSSALYKYGITQEGYEAALARQGGVCAICGGKQENTLFNVDHDHSCCPGTKTCGKCIRGLLCKRCNAGLGMFRDSPELLAAAVRYLEEKL